MIVLEIALLVLLHLAVVAGVLAVILGLSGNFILLGLCLAVAWIGRFQHLPLWVWLVLLALAVLGEIVESLLGVAAAARFGASRWGMIGTFLGGIGGAVVGTAWIPVLGSIVGAFLGSFLGAFGGELLGGRAAGAGARAGFGAFLGKAAATTFKLAIGVTIAVFTLKSAYPLI